VYFRQVSEIQMLNNQCTV